MTQISRPWSLTAIGDAGPYSSDQWQLMYQRMVGFDSENANKGVFRGIDSELEVLAQAVPNTTVRVLSGSALVRGTWYYSDSTETLTPAANGSGNPRIDTVVLRWVTASQTVRLAIVQGTPAASPVPPSLTQTAATFEIPLANLTLASGFASITQANIEDVRLWVNVPTNISNPFTNNSGATRTTGDVVVLDTTLAQAVTTTTTVGGGINKTLGVCRGRATNSSTVDVITQGVALVKTTGVIAIGDLLEPSATAGRAQASSTGRHFAIALQATSGTSAVFALLTGDQHYHEACKFQASNFNVVFSGGGTPNSGSASFTTGGIGTFNTGGYGFSGGASGSITIPATGLYWLQAEAQVVSNSATFQLVTTKIEGSGGAPTTISNEWAGASSAAPSGVNLSSLALLTAGNTVTFGVTGALTTAATYTMSGIQMSIMRIA